MSPLHKLPKYRVVGPVALASDGFPIDMSPLAWAHVCTPGDTYDYASRGMVPVPDGELAILDFMLGMGRGLDLMADSAGLRVEEETDELEECDP